MGEGSSEATKTSVRIFYNRKRINLGFIFAWVHALRREVVGEESTVFVLLWNDDITISWLVTVLINTLLKTTAQVPSKLSPCSEDGLVYNGDAPPPMETGCL